MNDDSQRWAGSGTIWPAYLRKFGTLHWLDDREDAVQIDQAYTIVCGDPLDG